MGDDVTLHAIAAYDRTQLRLDPGAAVKVFAALNQLTAEDDHPDRAEVVAAAKTMLAAALESPKNKDDEQLSRQLAWPVVTYLGRAALFDEFVIEASELRRHPAIKDFSAITDLLPAGLDERAEPIPAQATTELAPSMEEGATDDEIESAIRRLSKGEIPAMAEGISLGNPRLLLSRWAGCRESVLASDRNSADAWCLRLAVLKSRSCPLEFAEALYADGDFWGSQSATEFCAGLGQPIDAARTGELQAALLNSRISELRPRLFLQAPDTRVLRRIADPLRNEAERLESDLRDKLQFDLINAVAQIRRELARPQAPRKQTIRDIEETIETLLSDLGCEAFGELGEIVPFSPRQHQTAVPLATDAPVRIEAPGLRRLTPFTQSERAEHIRHLTNEERQGLADRVVVLIKATVSPAPTLEKEITDGT